MQKNKNSIQRLSKKISYISIMKKKFEKLRRSLVLMFLVRRKFARNLPETFYGLSDFYKNQEIRLFMLSSLFVIPLFIAVPDAGEAC